MVSRSSSADVSFSEDEGYGSGATLRPRTDVRAFEARDVRDGVLTAGESPSDSSIRPRPDCRVRLVERERAWSRLPEGCFEALLCLLLLVELLALEEWWEEW